MIRLDRPVIVEGKYDRITLENVIDALIIPTDGFRIFKSPEKAALIRAAAQKDKGVIVMTDSDSAGAVIRAYLKKLLGNTEIINVYVPALKGKERRKAKYSKEGLLGVEGMSPEVIAEALQRCGVSAERSAERKKITKSDMFSSGLSGRANSADMRRDFLSFLGLPQTLSSSAMLDVMNNMMNYEEFFEKVSLWQKRTDNV